MPKTGTTALQYALSAAAPALAKRGIDYPIFFRNNERQAHHALSSELLVTKSLGGPEVSQFLAYVSENDAQDILISSEAFTNALAPARLEAFARFVDACGSLAPTRLVIALRRIDTFLESMYLHSAKADAIAVSFREYIDARRPWSTNLLRGLAAIRRLPAVTELICIKYTSGRAFEGEIMQALMPGEANFHPPKVKRQNERLGLKAHTLLFNLGWFSQVHGLAVDRHALILDFEHGHFAFDDEVYAYSLMPLEDAERLHARTLEAAIETGEKSYAEFFASDKIRHREVVTLDRAILSAADLDKLAAHLAVKA
jgi:hypothetical protein